MRKGTELALKIVLGACIVLVLVEIWWIVQDSVFDRQEMEYTFEKSVNVGKRVLAQASVNARRFVEAAKNSEAVKDLL